MSLLLLIDISIFISLATSIYSIHSKKDPLHPERFQTSSLSLEICMNMSSCSLVPISFSEEPEHLLLESLQQEDYFIAGYFVDE